MRNPLLTAAAEVLNAYEAVRKKLGTHRIDAASDGGLWLIMPGKPALLITLEAARDWANDLAEAEHQ